MCRYICNHIVHNRLVRSVNVHTFQDSNTQISNLIKLNQFEQIQHFADRFDSKWNSVWGKIIRKSEITFQIWFDLTEKNCIHLKIPLYYTIHNTHAAYCRQAKTFLALDLIWWTASAYENLATDLWTLVCKVLRANLGVFKGHGLKACLMAYFGIMVYS